MFWHFNPKGRRYESPKQLSDTEVITIVLAAAFPSTCCVHDVFRQEGATNVKWVWTINSTGFDSRVPPWQPLYPGDAYVDAIGIDAYNNDPNFYRSFSSTFDATYDSVVAANTNDAIWIAETGSVEGASSTQKADWIRNAFFVALPERFPRVTAVGYWHQDNWVVNSSQASLDARKQIVADARYTGTLP